MKTLSAVALPMALVLSLSARHLPAQNIDDVLAGLSHLEQQAFAGAFQSSIEVRAFYTAQLTRDMVKSGALTIDPIGSFFGITYCDGLFFVSYEIAISDMHDALAKAVAMMNGATMAEACDRCFLNDAIINTILHEYHHVLGLGSGDHCEIYCNEKKYWQGLLDNDPKYAPGMPRRNAAMAYLMDISARALKACDGAPCP